MSRFAQTWLCWSCALTLVVVSADCSRANERQDAPLVPRTHAIGAWEGSGDHTIGFASTSGRFRIRWEARAEPGAAADGRLHVAVHSGVSGRLLQDVIDQQGPGAGAVNFEDDPRPYDLLVTASGLAWSIAVDEIVLVRPGS